MNDSSQTVMRQSSPAGHKSLTLPIRLVPRRKPTAAWAAFWLALGMSSFLMLEYEHPLTIRYAGVTMLIIVVAISVALILLMKLLPRSPFLHVRLGFDGLRVSRPFHYQHYTWSELSSFSVLEGKQPWRPSHVVGAFWTYQLGAAESGLQAPEVALRINVGPYGGGLVEDDAAALAAWLNELRERADLGQFDEHDEVSVPDAFRNSAISEWRRQDTPPAAPKHRHKTIANRQQTIVRN